MKTITLPCFGIELTVDEENPGGGSIESDLEREKCPSCGLYDCCFNCDGSTGADDACKDHDVELRLSYNGAMDGIEALVLAHACAGIDVESPAYLEGIETAVEGAANNL